MTNRIAFLFILLFACGTMNAENLLRNASMAEQSADGAWPASWEPRPGVETELVAHGDGTRGLSVFRADGDATVVQSGLALVPGEEYRFKAMVRGPVGTKGCITIERDEPDAWSMRTDFTCGGDWQTVAVTGIMPDQGSEPFAVFCARQGSKIEFWAPVVDLFSGKPKNGTFNSGAIGWTLENAVAEDSGSAYGKVMKLDGTTETARISQAGIQLKGGQLYKLSYDVKGGTDRQFQDSQGATWFRVAAYEGDTLVPDNEIWQDSFSDWQHKFLTFMADHDMEVTIVGELRNPGTVYFDNITLEPTISPVPPVEVVLDCPWNYHDVTVAGTPGRLSGAVFLSIPAALVTVSFNGETASLPGGAETPFDFAVPSAVGEYPVEAIAFDADGERIASAVKTFRVVPPPSLAEGAHKVAFDAKRVMHVDGKPFFPICSCNFRQAITFEEAMKTVDAMGFNMVICTTDELDVVAEHGMLAMVMVPSEIHKERTPEELADWLARPTGRVVEAMNHPATVAWFSIDEPAWAGRPLAPIQGLYETMGRLDPSRPVFLNEAPRGKVEDLRPYANASDIYGVDIYPIPCPNSHSDLDDKMMTSVGKYTDICQEVVRGRKPIWMTLQAFSWGVWSGAGDAEYPYPTREETRFMIYEAISHGATGLMFWGTMTVPPQHRFVADLAANTREVKELSRYLVGDTIRGEVACETESIRICQKRTAEGDDLWIVLNESSEPVTAVLKGKLPAELFVVGEERTVRAGNGVLMAEFAPYSLHIYRDAARPAASPVNP